MDKQLSQLQSLSQKDKSAAYTSLLKEALSQSNPTSLVADVHTLVDAVVNQDNVNLVVGRQVLSELVKQLSEGVVKDREVRKRIVQDTIALAQRHLVSYEEQVRVFCICGR